MIRKPTSGDSEQREREAERARRHSQLSAAEAPRNTDMVETPERSEDSDAEVPAHGAGKGESAHGAIPRSGIDSE